MAQNGKTESGNWTISSGGIDALILACLFAVAATGVFALSPHSEPATRPSQFAQSVVPIEEFKPKTSPTVEQFYPSLPPQSYVPVLPEPVIPTLDPDSRPPMLTRLENPRTDKVLNASEYFTPGNHYGCAWRPENVEPTTTGALLAVHKRPEGGAPCTAAEMQTAHHYGYGRYEVIMRPARGSGLVSAFFTYTGAYFGDPHDEIDIEFLGTDTTRIHFNYFRKGRVGSHEIFDLPFDAAEADRLYAFEWTPESITWFVEGIPIYQTPAGATDLPVAAGKIYLNAWAGADNIRQWTGDNTFRSGAGAHYSCVSFVPMGGKGPSCAEVYEPPVVLSP